MEITWNTDVNAPCCPGEIVAEDGRTVLIQTDWDYPGFAITFGWDPCEECTEPCHRTTDGTVDCKARTASEMIQEAGNFLDERVEYHTEVDDPGYFENIEEE